MVTHLSLRLPLLPASAATTAVRVVARHILREIGNQVITQHGVPEKLGLLVVRLRFSGCIVLRYEDIILYAPAHHTIRSLRPLSWPTWLPADGVVVMGAGGGEAMGCSTEAASTGQDESTSSYKPVSATS